MGIKEAAKTRSQKDKPRSGQADRSASDPLLSAPIAGATLESKDSGRSLVASCVASLSCKRSHTPPADARWRRDVGRDTARARRVQTKPSISSATECHLVTACRRLRECGLSRSARRSPLVSTLAGTRSRPPRAARCTPRPIAVPLVPGRQRPA